MMGDFLDEFLVRVFHCLEYFTGSFGLDGLIVDAFDLVEMSYIHFG